ncbi:MAG: hypothetical protein GX270_06155 [Clostridiaceae bacterium]|nr:hypothetical protein [Clostridiaceae bacterium]
MEKKALQKIIKEFFTPFARQHNFKFYKTTLMLRVLDDTLHIINFDLPSNGLNCNIAIQPLYIPSETITLTFGNRLNHFKTNLPGTWGYSNDKIDIEKDLSQVKELLEQNAVPWFNEFGSPEGIISFIEANLAEDDNNNIVGFPPVLKRIYLGFSYLYTNKLGLAVNLLQEVLELCKEDKRAWVIQQNEMIDNILILTEKEPDKVNTRLNEFVKATKENLKIKL